MGPHRLPCEIFNKADREGDKRKKGRVVRGAEGKEKKKII